MQKMDAFSPTQFVSFWLQDARYFSISDELVFSFPAFFIGEDGAVLDQHTLEKKVVSFTQNLQERGIQKLIVAPEKSARSESILSLPFDSLCFFKRELAKHHISLAVEAEKIMGDETHSLSFFTKLKPYQHLYDALFFRQKEAECSLFQPTEYEKVGCQLDFLQQQLLEHKIACSLIYYLETKDLFHAERQAEWILKLAKEVRPFVTIAFDGVISLSNTKALHPLCDKVAMQKCNSHLTLAPSTSFDLFSFEPYLQLLETLPSHSVTSFLFKGQSLPDSMTLHGLFFDAMVKKMISRKSLDFCVEMELVDRFNLQSGDARKVRGLFSEIFMLGKSKRQAASKKNEKINKKQEAYRVLIEELVQDLRLTLPGAFADEYIKVFFEL